jgi:hypothetical protein
MHESMMMGASHLCCIGVALAPLAGGLLLWFRPGRSGRCLNSATGGERQNGD